MRRFWTFFSGQHRLHGPTAIDARFLAARQQCVFLALEVTPFIDREHRLLALAYRIQRIAKAEQDIGPSEPNFSRRYPFICERAIRFPHVHHPQAATFRGVFELCHASPRVVLDAKLDREATNLIAHHEMVSMALADRDRAIAEGFRSGFGRMGRLRAHVLLHQCLDHTRAETQFLGNTTAATPSHVISMRRACAGCQLDNRGYPTSVNSRNTHLSPQDNSRTRR
jgi:hypothetical protein